MDAMKLLPLFLAACCTARAADTPNFVLAMADDQGAGDMAYCGHPVLRTPNFDSLSREGVRFDRFYAAAPVCSPTRGSVMTGRTPNRFGCFKWGYALRPQEVTVAEALRKIGYTTGHFGKWHLGSLRPDSPTSPGHSGFDTWISSPNFFDVDPWLARNGKAFHASGEGSEIIVDAALEFIRRAAKKGRPFLAVVWFGSPHAPHIGTGQDLALYKDQPEKMRPFLAEITAMDRAMGKLRKGLLDAGVSRDTVLWYCSDNGAIPQGSTGGLRGKKGSIWEGGLRVPALLEWPARVTAPISIDAPCCTFDIFPTLLEMAGAPLSEKPPLDGTSLLSLIEGRSKSRNKPLGFWDYAIKGLPVKSSELLEKLSQEQLAGAVRPAPEAEPIPAAQCRSDYPTNVFPGHAAWIADDWKLHRIQGKDGTVKCELYHLMPDPTESRDLMPTERDRASRMRADLESWLQSVVASLNGKDY